jgi:hypothetical protein
MTDDLSSHTFHHPEHPKKSYGIPNKAKSKVWRIFRLEFEGSKSCQRVAFCTLCNMAPLSFCGSTSNLRDHIQSKHTSAFSKLFLRNEKTGQRMLETFKPLPPLAAVDTEAINLRIVFMMAKDLQPTSIVEDAGFQALIAHLQPRYKIPSRKVFATKLIPEEYVKVSFVPFSFNIEG